MELRAVGWGQAGPPTGQGTQLEAGGLLLRFTALLGGVLHCPTPTPRLFPDPGLAPAALVDTGHLRLPGNGLSPGRGLMLGEGSTVGPSDLWLTGQNIEPGALPPAPACRGGRRFIGWGGDGLGVWGR